VVFAREATLAQSGFRFYFPSASAMGVLLPGDRTDIDFRVERRADGSLWMAPVRTGTRVTLYSTNSVADLSTIDVAPEVGFSSGAIEARPGYGYVFEMTASDGLHYGAVRVSHISKDYVILDWSYQSDPGNPELRRTRGDSVKPF
jgi:hypothetical protein